MAKQQQNENAFVNDWINQNVNQNQNISGGYVQAAAPHGALTYTSANLGI